MCQQKWWVRRRSLDHMLSIPTPTHGPTINGMPTIPNNTTMCATSICSTMSPRICNASASTCSRGHGTTRAIGGV